MPTIAEYQPIIQKEISTLNRAFIGRMIQINFMVEDEYKKLSAIHKSTWNNLFRTVNGKAILIDEITLPQDEKDKIAYSNILVKNYKPEKLIIALAKTNPTTTLAKALSDNLNAIQALDARYNQIEEDARHHILDELKTANANISPLTANQQKFLVTTGLNDMAQSIIDGINTWNKTVARIKGDTVLETLSNATQTIGTLISKANSIIGNANRITRTVNTGASILGIGGQRNSGGIIPEIPGIPPVTKIKQDIENAIRKLTGTNQLPDTTKPPFPSDDYIALFQAPDHSPMDAADNRPRIPGQPITNNNKPLSLYKQIKIGRGLFYVPDIKPSDTHRYDVIRKQIQTTNDRYETLAVDRTAFPSGKDQPSDVRGWVPMFVEVLRDDIDPALRRIWFRPKVSAINANGQATWSDEQFVNRITPIRSYSGFHRTFNFTLVINADSLEELKLNYYKINMLYNTLIPNIDNSHVGSLRRRAPLIKLKLGDVISNWSGDGLVGIFTNINLSGDDDAGWETFEGRYKVPKRITWSGQFDVIDDFQSNSNTNVIRIKDRNYWALMNSGVHPLDAASDSCQF